VAGPYLIGIDEGTQSAKVVVYDGAGAVVSQGTQALRPMSRLADGGVVHPDDDLWDSLVAAAREAMAGFPGDISEIVGVGLCTIRCCKAFLRADGSLVEPVVSWMDDRAYRPYLPDDPALAYATTSSGYIAQRLTGERRDTAANNILLQWPIDSDAWDWSDDPELLREFDLTRKLLFDLQLPGEVGGPVMPEAAAATGIPAGLPVVQTANDKAVEALGAGSLGETTALVSLGTFITAMVHGGENRRKPTHFWTNFASIPHRYLYESDGVRRGMWTLSWFLELVGGEVADLEREAARVPAGSDGLMTVLDWLAPTDRPFRKGVMLGFDARHTRAHLYRSILEGIALTMKHNVDAMCDELGLELTEIVVSGGGAASPLFMQIFADAFGLPASRSSEQGGASLGAAICAAVGTGVHPDFEAAVRAMTGPRESFSPDTAAADTYRQMNEAVYQTIRAGTDDVLERSYPLFH
jgi:sugar (pentulose or hexulose) kinase